MNVLSAHTARKAKALTIISAALLLTSAAGLRAQIPYALPYTIQSYSGGGTALTLTAPATASCAAVSNTALTYDDYGDGCQYTSGSIVLGAGQALGNIHDINVDPQGNIYFLDINSANHTALRRIDARSGRITMAAGSLTTQTDCTAATDAYGDNCLATDGLANALGVHTTFPVLRGFAVAKNGDIFLTGYQTNVVQKISVSTGIMTLIGGTLSNATKTATGVSGFGGNGASALTAHFNSPRDIAVDNAGNIYVADTGNNEIREIIATTGIINVVAGSPLGTAGLTGDGGPATSATITSPEGLDIDAAGDIFISGSTVRVVYEGGAAAAKLISTTNAGITPVVGYIYTVFGGGAGSYTSGGPYLLATAVGSGSPRKFRLDSRGNIYSADNGNNVIEFVDTTTGYMHVIAGTVGKTTGGVGCTPLYGTTDAFGDNCPGIDATLNPNAAMSVTVDADENVYIADSGNNLIRKVATGRDFPTIAVGSSVTQILDIHFALGDGPSALNPFTTTGSADFVVGTPNCTLNADTTKDCLVPVTFKPSTGALESAALKVTSLLNGVTSIGVQGSGVAAEVALDPGAVSSIATGLKLPLGAAVDGAGNTYIADTGNNRVVVYSASGTPTVLAGTGTAGYTGDNGQATLATLSAPSAVGVTPGNLIYIADTGNNVVRVVNPSTGVISTVAGGATSLCGDARDIEGDGCLGTSAKFSKPAGLAADIYGNIYVSDTGNNIVRQISPTGYVSLIAGGASAVCSSTTLTIDSFGDNCPPTQAIFNGPTGLAVDSNMNIYIADTGDSEIRKIVATSGLVTSFAGTGVAGSGSNGGLAIAAQVNVPTGVGVDAAGNVYIADTGNQAIRMVPASGVINTVVGTVGTSGNGTLPGAATTTALNNPSAVAVFPSGNLVVLDSGNNRAIADNRGGVAYNFGRTNIGFSSPILSIQETGVGSQTATLGSPLLTSSGSSSYFTLNGSLTNGCGNGSRLTAGAGCGFSAYFSPTSAILNQSVSASYTEQNSNTVNAAAPFINLSGFAAILTNTSAAVALTTPGVTPQYALPFSVTTTVTAVACNTAAPNCYPVGNVTVSVDGLPVGTSALTTGSGLSASATLSITSPLSVGTHSITAVYSTDGFYASTTSPAFTVTIAPENTTSTASASPNPVVQFTPLTLSASIKAVSGKPTGSFSFYAGSVLLGSAGITPSTGVATLPDTLVAATVTTPAYYENFGLAAGTYSITAVYSGDPDFSTSTSVGYSLQITALPQSFTAILVNPATGTPSNLAVTYPGATTQLDLFITPSNTLNGTVTFACTGMPANTDCGFTPSTLPFAPTALFPTPEYTQVTFFTNVNPAVIGPGQAGFNGSWLVMGGSIILLVILRRKARRHKLLLLLPAFFLLFTSCALFSGCGSGSSSQNFTTALGTYSVNVIATGPNSQSISLPVTFIVAAATTH